MRIIGHVKSTKKARPSTHNSRNYSESWQLFRQDDTSLAAPVMDARIYGAGSGASYAAVWFRLPHEEYDTGLVYAWGRAGGYGYDMDSGAFVDALHNMGVQWESGDPTGGEGLSSNVEAVRACLERELGVPLMVAHTYA